MNASPAAKKIRSSNLELLRIFCILFIIADHFTGQSGVVEGSTFSQQFFYCSATSLSRVACSVFIIISAWFSVGRDFKFSRILHVWLTVIMYTVPIAAFMLLTGNASRGDLVVAFHPVQYSPLWFAGYYIVLVFLSPLLNLLLTKGPKNLVTFFLGGMFCFLCLYPTVTADLGFFAHDIWILVFLYVLTGYIRLYVKKPPDARVSIAVFCAAWLLLTFHRTAAARYGLGTLAYYCEIYRARLQTIPNLIMAYSLFFGFLGLKMKPSSLINKAAGASLGVYCMHQVPCWYTYLWTQIFRAPFHIELLHNKKRMLYTVCCILTVWLAGTVIELLRAAASDKLIESRSFCKKLCTRVDACVNGAALEDGTHPDGRRLFFAFAAACTVYFLVLKLYALGMI